VTYALLIAQSPAAVAAKRIETLKRALDSAVESANTYADIASEWSGTTPRVFTANDFITED
jgi:hypothetical protein